MKSLTLGDRIKERRIEIGLTQDKFAALTNVSKWTIVNWESNKRIPLATALINIALALKTTADYLLYGIGEAEETPRTHSIKNPFDLPVYSLKDIAEKPEYFFSVIVPDTSMEGIGLPCGSKAVINPFDECNNMDIALIKYRNMTAIRKICYMPNGSIEIISAEQRCIIFPQAENSSSNFIVYGKVCYVLSVPRHGI